MTTLTLNEHKLLMRLSREGMLSYDEHTGNALSHHALDHLIELGLVRVFEIFTARRGDVAFSWDGVPNQDDPLNFEPYRAINITDRGRQALP